MRFLNQLGSSRVKSINVCKSILADNRLCLIKENIAKLVIMKFITANGGLVFTSIQLLLNCLNFKYVTNSTKFSLHLTISWRRRRLRSPFPDGGPVHAAVSRRGHVQRRHSVLHWRTVLKTFRIHSRQFGFVFLLIETINQVSSTQLDSSCDHPVLYRHTTVTNTELLNAVNDGRSILLTAHCRVVRAPTTT